MPRLRTEFSMIFVESRLGYSTAKNKKMQGAASVNYGQIRKGEKQSWADKNKEKQTEGQADMRRNRIRTVPEPECDK